MTPIERAKNTLTDIHIMAADAQLRATYQRTALEQIAAKARVALAELDAALADQFTAADDTQSKSRMARVAIERAAQPAAQSDVVAFRLHGPKGTSEWQDAQEYDETGLSLFEAVKREVKECSNADELRIELAYSSPLAQPQVRVTNEMVDMALRAHVAGGAKVHDWLPMRDEGNLDGALKWRPSPVAHAIMRAALEAVFDQLARAK